jgi:molybdopterin molybdotransferase
MTRFVGHGRSEVTVADELISIEAHLDAILDSLPTPEPIELRLVDALGMVLSDDVHSDTEIPSFANSAMDGYAVVAADLSEARTAAPVRLPVVGEVVAGTAELPVVSSGRVVRIMTGAPLPPGADAVVPVETTSGDNSQVGFHRPTEPGSNVRSPGEDVHPGQRLAVGGRRLTPAVVALLASAGVTRVRCLPPPRVVILSSGDELVRPEDTPAPGQIRDSNGPMLSALVRAAGGVPFSTGIIKDDRKALRHAFDTNSGHADLFVCTGGASAGTRDLLPDVIASLGTSVAQKVAMKPGMPQIRGRIGGVPVIGLPGNPVSAFVSFEVFVRPAIRMLQGRKDVARPNVTAIAGEPLTAPPHKRGFTRVQLSRDGDAWVATPTGAQGSHLLTSIAFADGLAVVPEHVTEIPAGDEVLVHILVD